MMIGVFDSGYGGLTVLKPLMKKLPEYDYIYLGDNARAPYGPRHQDTIKQYSQEAIQYLFNSEARLIITACNTVSALALRYLQQKFIRDENIKDKNILGVLIPVVEYAAAQTENNKIGVVGTKGTVNSRAYDIELHKINPKLKVFSQACPLLVPFIEENWHKKPEAKMILKKYLRPLKSKNIDVLILGCTHYPLMYKDFCNYMGKSVNVLPAGEIVAESLKNYLARHPEIDSLLSKKGKRIFMTTNSEEHFKRFANSQLNMNISEVQKIRL